MHCGHSTCSGKQYLSLILPPDLTLRPAWPYLKSIIAPAQLMQNCHNHLSTNRKSLRVDHAIFECHDKEAYSFDCFISHSIRITPEGKECEEWLLCLTQGSNVSVMLWLCCHALVAMCSCYKLVICCLFHKGVQKDVQKELACYEENLAQALINNSIQLVNLLWGRTCLKFLLIL